MSIRSDARARIIVIDDDHVLAELMQTLLVESSFDVVVCRRWQEAHQFVLRERPDLVVLDLRLGDSEYGWRVLDHMTLDPSTRHIPVIICSGAHESLQAHAPALLREHGVYILAKPFDLDSLLGVVDEAMTANPPLLRLNTWRSPRNTGAESGSSTLTPREHEVARLIARGYTNRQIANELVLTPGTVANHVAHILHKLECTSRIQVAIWSMRGAQDQQPLQDTEEPGRRFA
jgi:DNA-binding NarL/FixJ family response regulator